MLSFLTAFRKAKLGNLRLIYDCTHDRYLITAKRHWQTWPKHTLIINFETR